LSILPRRPTVISTTVTRTSGAVNPASTILVRRAGRLRSRSPAVTGHAAGSGLPAASSTAAVRRPGRPGQAGAGRGRARAGAPSADLTADRIVGFTKSLGSTTECREWSATGDDR
jgi:hypothetical protein